MNNLVTTNKLPNGNTQFTARARWIGRGLYLSNLAAYVTIEMTESEQQKAFNTIIEGFKQRSLVAVEVQTTIGRVLLDCHFCDELAGMIFVNKVDDELGDLLSQYPPSK